MIKTLLLTLLLFTSLLADKVLYLSYKDVPKRVVKGEVISVTIRTLTTVLDYDDVEYEFSNYYGMKVLNLVPERTQKGKYLFDKFYFLVDSSKAKLPTVTASILAENEYDTSSIYGSKLNVISLNPKKDFSNIIANSFELIDYKTTSFDERYNIVIFIAKATNSDITALHFQNVQKQGIESYKDSYMESRITYYAIIDKRIENFSFTYFNLIKNKYISLNIPIEVNDDSVATQSDLKPKDQSHNKIKAVAALIVALIVLIYVILKKKYIYIIVVIIPLGYMAYLLLPSKVMCIKKGSNIYLLPVRNGTIFEKTKTQYHLLEEGSVKNFTKVKLYNDKIGWVKDEDICSY